MNEFGGRSELGRRAESDKAPEKRRSGDWSLDLKHASWEVREKRVNIVDQLGSRPVEATKPNPDPLGECKGESDLSVFSASPFTKTPPKPAASAPIKKRVGDWSLDLIMPDGKRLGDSKNPAEDALKE